MIFMEILTEEESNMWELNLLVLKFVFHGVADPGEDLRFPVMDFSVGSSIDLSMYRDLVRYHTARGRICGLYICGHAAFNLL